MNQVDRLCDLVSEEIASLCRSDGFQAWINSESLAPDDLVVLNNSFLYREGITTTSKSTKYLCLAADKEAEPSLPVSVVTSVSRINVRFKRIQARRVGRYEVRRLQEAVQEEVEQLGSIVFALVGRIADDRPVDIALDGVPKLAMLRYEPTQSATAEIRDSTLVVSRLDDIDVVWRATRETAKAGGVEVEQLAERFEDSLANLREAAGRPIRIDDVSGGAPSILSSVVARVTEQTEAYEQALDAHLEHPHDAEAYNEFLRIAYNFADGAKALISLVVGLSDLKPLLFWLTIKAQSDLADRFGQLPFALVGKAKPSMERYRRVIAGARNRAFHDVFSFGRPFHVALTGDAFRTAELHLFREYANRGKPALDFEDREVVELLEGFTRSPEGSVPEGFWEGNLEVVRGVASLAQGLLAALLAAAPSGRKMAATPGSKAPAKPRARRSAK